MKKTKIICTLGPSSCENKVIEKLIKNGMDIARINFSHGTHENNGKIIKKVKKISLTLKKNVSIMADLQGPKIRLGDFPDTKIKAKEKVIFTTESFDPKKKKFPIQYKELWKDLKEGDLIRIADGIFEFKVLKISNKEIHTTVLNGGIIKKNKGINCPTASISAHPLTKKDLKDLKYALGLGIDFVALSFVRRAKDILDLRKKINNKVKIISKIERHEAIKNLESIAKVSDALMVARGDLGVEIDFFEVPIVQKEIIHLGNILGKPVITATQVFQSMTQNPVPTRAEVSDAANAVFDFSDAVMLSDETASGKYPGRSCKHLCSVIKRAEKTKLFSHFLKNRIRERYIPEENALSLAACQVAEDTSANSIAIFSDKISVFNQVLKHRPPQEIFCFAESEQTAKHLSLTWGANKVFLGKEGAKKVLKNKKAVVLKSIDKNESLKIYKF